jgi:hypothetical protein
MKITREQMKKIKDAMCLAEWFVEGDTCEAKDKATDKAALKEAKKAISQVLDEELLDDAIENLCAFVQDRLGVTKRDAAERFWTTECFRDTIRGYINFERNIK